MEGLAEVAQGDRENLDHGEAHHLTAVGLELRRSPGGLVHELGGPARGLLALLRSVQGRDLGDGRGELQLSLYKSEMHENDSRL